MLCNHFTEELLGLQGVKITNAEQEENLIIHLELERKSQNSSFIQRRSQSVEKVQQKLGFFT